MPGTSLEMYEQFMCEGRAEAEEFEQLVPRLASALRQSGEPNGAGFRVLVELFRHGTPVDAPVADRLVLCLWDCAAGERYVKADWSRLQQLVKSRFLRLKMMEGREA